MVPVYELGQRANGQPYYTMRKITGGTLGDAMAGATTLPQRLMLLPRFIDVCQTMAYSHDQRIIHRDLKPENVMLGPFGETLVLDWGLAKWLDGIPESATPITDSIDPALSADGDAWQTVEGSLIGTPAYMPPEQAMGRLHAIDARSDVYALGSMLFELLCGRTPFVASNPIAMAVKVTRSEVPAPRSIEPGCPAELEAIVLRALQKDPADRYADAQAMAADLVAFEAGGLVSAHEYGWQDLLVRAWRRHKRRLVVGAVVLALAGGAWSIRGAADARAEAARQAEVQRAQLAEVDRLLDEIREEVGVGVARTHALRLISLRSPAVVTRLMVALADPHGGVRSAVAHALGGVGDRAAVPALVARLAEGVEPEDDVRVEITEALAAIGDSAADAPVHAARRRAGSNSDFWQRTETAFSMIPPAPIAADQQANAAAWIEQGVRYVEKQRYEQGIAAYRRAMALAPTDARPWNNLGIALRRQRRYAEAQRALEQALKLQPDFPLALANLVVVQRHRGAYPASLVVADRLVALGGRLSKLAHRSRARSRWTVGDFAGARADLDVVLAQDATSRQTVAVDGLYWAARGDWDRALGCFARAIERDPNFALAYQQRGRIQAAQQRWETARKDLRRAMQIDPQLADVRADLAGVLRHLNQDTAALRTLQRAVVQRAKDAGTHAALAILGYGVDQNWAEASAALAAAEARAMPGDAALLGLLRAGVHHALGTQPPAELLQPRGDQLWHDRLLAVAGGAAANALAAEAYTPTMRGELALATWLGHGEAGLAGLPAASVHAALPAPPSALAVALLRALRARG